MGPYGGTFYHAYVSLDIYSRRSVAYRVEEAKRGHLAMEMFEGAFAREGAPAAVHSDSGAAMISGDIAALLAAHVITKTHNRPMVSNGNPCSESVFKTLKHRRDSPLDLLRHHRGQAMGA